MSKLLRFLIEHKLSDSGAPLKAYSIAVDALGRDDSFDTQIDSYPRVQMGRLRRMLDHFYLRDGGDHRLSIPYNHYAIELGPNMLGRSDDREEDQPEFIGQSAVASSTGRPPVEIRFKGRAWALTRARIRNILASLLAITSLVIGTIFYFSHTAGTDEIAYPAIVVEAPDGVINSSTRTKAQAMQIYFIDALENFDQIRVYDGKSNSRTTTTYLLESSILSETADHIQLRLVDSLTREVIWSDRIFLAENSDLDRDLGSAVIAIVSPYGAIAINEMSKYDNDFALGYPCLLQFHKYMRYKDPANLEPTLKCMEKSTERFPDDAYLLGTLAMADNFTRTIDRKYRISGSATEIAEKAAKLDSTSATANFAVAQSAFFESDCRKGLVWGQRAVELNPLDSRIMGYLGTYMLGCKMPEGEEYATRALAMDPDVDTAVAATVAFQMLRRGDAKSAQSLSLKYIASAPGEKTGLELSYILSTAMLNEKREARRAWKRLAKRSGLPETARPREVLEKWMVGPDLIPEIAVMFEQAQLY